MMFILKLGKPIAHDIKLKIIYKDNNYFKKTDYYDFS